MGEWTRDDPRDVGNSSNKPTLLPMTGIPVMQAGSGGSGGSRPGSGLAGFIAGRAGTPTGAPAVPPKEKSRNPLGLGRFGGGAKKKK